MYAPLSSPVFQNFFWNDFGMTFGRIFDVPGSKGIGVVLALMDHSLRMALKLILLCK